jgi:hypothetical protein
MTTLLDSMRQASAHEQAAALADRLPTAGMVGPYLNQRGRADQFQLGREADGSPASPRYALGLGAAACLAAAIIGGWAPAGRRRLFGGPVTTTGSGARTTARSDKKSF